MKPQTTKNCLFSSVAIAAVMFGTLAPCLVATSALAQDGGKGTQTQQGPGGGSGEGAGAGGGQGSTGGGHEGGDMGSGGHDDGHDADAGSHDDGGAKGSAGSGPQGGHSEDGDGGKPVWAQEGIPEVELGRLNVIRSPSSVLNRALAEAVATFDPATMEALYESSASGFAAEVSQHWDTVVRIDSPVQNLAILKELWTTGATSLPNVQPASIIELSAILLGSASDKTVPISFDTVKALAIIVGVQMSDASIASIAGKAESVRAAIALAHG